MTYFVGSVFFTLASYGQLVQAQSPAMTGPGTRDQQGRGPVRWRAWKPSDPGWLAAATQFPGTLFFNVSTFVALAQNATVQQKDQHVWRPDLLGSTLFLVASGFGIAALGVGLAVRARSLPWWIAWVNMLGSILFMFSVIASYVVPGTGELVDVQVSIVGTLLGAVCFFVGAALMLPAWRQIPPSTGEAALLGHP